VQTSLSTLVKESEDKGKESYAACKKMRDRIKNYMQGFPSNWGISVGTPWWWWYFNLRYFQEVSLTFRRGIVYLLLAYPSPFEKPYVKHPH